MIGVGRRTSGVTFVGNRVVSNFANPGSKCACESESDRLIAQAQRLEDRVHDYISKSDQTFRLLLVIGGLAVSAAQIEAFQETATRVAVALLPVLFTLLLLISIQKGAETQALKEWQARLEADVRVRTGLLIHIWESKVSDHGTGRPSAAVFGQSAILAVLFVALWGFGAIAFWEIQLAFADGWDALGRVVYSEVVLLSVYFVLRGLREQDELKNRVAAEFEAFDSHPLDGDLHRATCEFHSPSGGG